MGPFTSIAQIKNANEAHGEKFFSAATMRWFNSRVLPEVINGRYFITSEKDMHRHDGPQPREYTIRRAENDGRIETIGAFGQFGTAAAARRRAAKLLPEFTPCANCREETVNPNFTCDRCARQ